MWPLEPCQPWSAVTQLPAARATLDCLAPSPATLCWYRLCIRCLIHANLAWLILIGFCHLITWTDMCATTCVSEVPSQAAPPMSAHFQDRTCPSMTGEKDSQQAWSESCKGTWYLGVTQSSAATDDPRAKPQGSKSLPLPPLSLSGQRGQTVMYTTFKLRLRYIYCLG